MNIVFLDADTIGSDIDFTGFSRIGQVTRYGSTTEEQMPDRIREADVIVVNKVRVDEQTVGEAPRLKLVCVSATGTNNLDMEFLDRRGIAWRNVAGYSTENVAQHTFALVFALLEKLSYYDHYVKSGEYMSAGMFTHFSNVFHELHGMTWGIIGLGNIGRRVADIAKVFGCRVIYYSTSGNHREEGYERTDLDTLLTTSDIVSVHAPLNRNTCGLIDGEAFRKMKNSALFINVGRGPIVVEEDLADALEQGEIAGAGLDVLCQEPLAEENPLRRITDSTRLIITPHMAWASVEARTRLMQMVLEQIREYFSA